MQPKMHLHKRLADQQDKTLEEIPSIPDRIDTPRDLTNKMGLSGKVNPPGVYGQNSPIPVPLSLTVYSYVVDARFSNTVEAM